jgi:hypothetical protein
VTFFVRKNMTILTAIASVLGAAPVFGQSTASEGRTLPPPRTVLFVGNSFTFGASSEVWRYRPDSVEDLNGTGVGGVPALFKRFSDEAGLSYRVVLETEGGKTLRFHYEERRALLDRAWDHVVLQEYSTLDPDTPGDPAQFGAYAARLTQMFRARNPSADIRLTATWSRPDLVYRDASPWRGGPVAAMGIDLDRAYRAVVAATPGVRAMVPVGLAFNKAIGEGVADADPFDGTDPGKIDLWGPDHYHASKFGYYLEALMVFGSITGLDPRTLGTGEAAARDLAIAPETASALQSIAARQLGAK